MFNPGPSTWTRSWQGWHRGDWHVRPAPMSAGKWFWLYRKGVRYTRTGFYADSAGFTTAHQARKFADDYDAQV